MEICNTYQTRAIINLCLYPITTHLYYYLFYSTCLIKTDDVLLRLQKERQCW